MLQSEMDSENRLSELYDNLSRYSYLLNRLKGSNPLTMHKSLRIPEEFQYLYPGKDKSYYLDDLVLKEADLPENPRILDAGCGFGGSIFRWYQQNPGTYHGFTLSKYQQKIANRKAKHSGLSQSCHFYLKNYSEPIDQKYDAIVAIEALIHSQDLTSDIDNFSRALLPKGRLLIVDDMALDEGIKRTEEFKLLRDLWLISDLPAATEYLKLLEKNKFKILSQLDLTPLLQFPSQQSVEKRSNRTAAIIRHLPLKSLQFFLKTHLGGFALQKLYRKGKMTYQLILAEKQH